MQSGTVAEWITALAVWLMLQDHDRNEPLLVRALSAIVVLSISAVLILEFFSGGK